MLDGFKVWSFVRELVITFRDGETHAYKKDLTFPQHLPNVRTIFQHGIFSHKISLFLLTYLRKTRRKSKHTDTNMGMWLFLWLVSQFEWQFIGVNIFLGLGKKTETTFLKVCMHNYATLMRKCMLIKEANINKTRLFYIKLQLQRRFVNLDSFQKSNLEQYLFSKYGNIYHLHAQCTYLIFKKAIEAMILHCWTKLLISIRYVSDRVSQHSWETLFLIIASSLVLKEIASTNDAEQTQYDYKT